MKTCVQRRTQSARFQLIPSYKTFVTTKEITFLIERDRSKVFLQVINIFSFPFLPGTIFLLFLFSSRFSVEFSCHIQVYLCLKIFYCSFYGEWRKHKIEWSICCCSQCWCVSKYWNRFLLHFDVNSGNFYLRICISFFTFVVFRMSFLIESLGKERKKFMWQT